MAGRNMSDEPTKSEPTVRHERVRALIANAWQQVEQMRQTKTHRGEPDAQAGHDDGG